MFLGWKQKYKFIFVLLGVALLAVGCGAPKGGSGDQITLRVWMPFVAQSDVADIIYAYTSAHPNVRIEFETKNFETYQEDLLNALAAGNGPDVFAINNAWLPKYIDKISAAPGDLWTFKDFKDAYVDTVVNDFTRSQQIYGSAMSVDSLALFYNKDLLGTVGFPEPAKTWDELREHAANLSTLSQDGYFSKSGAALGLNSNVNRSVDIVYLMLLQSGVIPWSSDGLNAQFSQGPSENPTAASDALAFYTSFANPSAVNYSWNSASDYSIDAFANGRAAYLYSYSYTRNTLAQKAPSLNYDVAQVPQKDLSGNAVNFANYFGEVVNKQSANKDVAWDFVKFLTSKDQLDRYYARSKQPSSRKDLINAQLSDPDIGVFAKANLTAKSFYKPDQERLDSIFGDLIDAITLRGTRVQDALATAESKANTLTQR